VALSRLIAVAVASPTVARPSSVYLFDVSDPTKPDRHAQHHLKGSHAPDFHPGSEQYRWLQKQLEEKKIDMTLASRTATSRPYLTATQPYEYSKGTLLVNKDFNPSNIKTVGAGRGYASVTWLKANKPQYTVVEFEDDSFCIKALQEKKVNACIMGREIAYFLLDKAKLNINDFDFTPIEYNYFLSFGIHIDNIELADILIKGLDAIPASRRNEILKKWLKEPYT